MDQDPAYLQESPTQKCSTVGHHDCWCLEILPFIDFWLLTSSDSFVSIFTHCRADGTVNQIEGEATQENITEPAKLGVKFLV